MKKTNCFSYLFITAAILSGLTGCGSDRLSGDTDNTSFALSVTVPPENSSASSMPEAGTIPSPWGDQVFTKAEVQAKLDAGLSDVWANYQINACLAAMDNLPENVLATLEAAVGAYRWETYEVPNFNGNWSEYFGEPDTVGQKLHAVLDLYGITPDTVFPAMNAAELEKKVAENPKIDLSQYATYEDGDAYFSYYSYYGCEVLAENDYVKIEGVRDITADYFEQINRVARITNVSEKPVYIRYSFIDKGGTGNESKYINALRALPEYDASYDKIDALKADQTVIPFISKDILYPGEFTYINIVYSGHTNLNSHWYFETYPINMGENEKPEFKDEDEKEDFFAKVRANEKSEDIALILKNRTLPAEECEVSYATIRGTLVNKDGEPLSFMPFRLMGADLLYGRPDTKEYFSSVDGSFCIKVPILFYKTDETYARYTIFVDGEKAPIDGRMNTMVIGELFALDGEIQEGVKYSDYIKGRRIYGQKSAFVQPTEAKNYEMTIVVPDKLDHLVYDYGEETDYGGQANYYDYGGDIIATVKFHDEERGANKTAYLNVFDHDGNLILRKPTGIQTCCVDVSPDGTLVATNITPQDLVIEDDFDMEYPANIGHATIFDLSGNVVFELQTGTRVMEISHDNKYVALDVNGADCVGVMEIATKKILWQDYRGVQIRYLIFSEDDSVLYMGSQECIAAYDAKDGTMLWQTFTGAGFPIDMILSGKYLYASPKGGTGGNDDKLLCIDRETGKMKWTFQTGSRGTKLSVSPDGTMLFWGNDTGARDIGLYILNAETGEPLWTVNYGGQAAWFTSDSEYVAIKDYGILEVFDRDGRKVATTACGDNSKMSWFVYIKDDLSRILNIAGGGGTGNSGWLYNMVLEDGYDREFIDSQRK